MKILHIIDSAGFYGAERMLLNLVHEQISLGLYPIIGSIGTQNCKFKELEKIAIRRGYPIELFRMKPGPNIFGAAQILKFAKNYKCDILHSHGYKGNILLGLLPADIRKIPLVSTIHGWTSTNIFSRIAFYEILDRFILRFLDAVVFVNKNIVHNFNFPEKLINSFSFIDNGIDDTPIQPKQLIPDVLNFCRKSPKLIGSIGRLSQEKGFSFLLDSFSELFKRDDDVRLIILGDGPLKNNLQKQISSLNIDDFVYMPGYVDDASQYLQFFDMLVIPSLQEGLPITLLEAMRAKTLIIASSVGGIPDALDNGNCGILVPPGNVPVLTKTLYSALIEKQNHTPMLHNAYTRFIDKYSSSRMASQYLELYRSLLN